MNLTPGEVNNIRAILYQLRIKAASPKPRRNTLINLVDKVSHVLNKAGRRRGQKATRLHFEEGDFETE